jgi:hypothetical protein
MRQCPSAEHVKPSCTFALDQALYCHHTGVTFCNVRSGLVTLPWMYEPHTECLHPKLEAMQF